MMRERGMDGGKVWKHKHSDLLWIQVAGGAEMEDGPRRKLQERKRKREKNSAATLV